MAENLCFLTQSRYYDFSKNSNFQFISCIILHDLSLLCSFVVSYPLYSCYFIFFSPYLIKIISLISPPFIAAVLLSLLLTTTTTATAFCPKFPQLKLEILQTVVHKLKSNFDELSGDADMCNFEIYNFVFDVTPSITIGNEGVDQVEEEEETVVLEDSVHGGWINDLTISELDIDKFEEKISLVKLTSRRPEKNQTIPEKTVHGGRRNDLTISEVDIDKFDEKNSLVKLTSRRPEKNQTIPEKTVHGGRRNDISISKLDIDEFEEKKSLVKLRSRRPEKNQTIPEKTVHGGRRNDITNIDGDRLQEENHLVKLFEELDRFEEVSPAIETSTYSDKVIGELRKQKQAPTTKFRSGSEAIDSNDNYKITQNSDAVNVDKSSSLRSNSSSVIGSQGSMREEKEWRRTLACKLFEDRHNSLGGEEGMDSLWEAYEINNSKNRNDAMINNKNMMMNNNGGINGFDEDDDDDEEEEDMGNGQLCCLQALKLSTGKMNLGMKKPNLLKISKALKGVGWLHHVKIKQSKKS